MIVPITGKMIEKEAKAFRELRQDKSIGFIGIC